MSKKPFPFKVCEECCSGGAGGDIAIDDAVSDTSENAVQNKVIKAYVDECANNLTAQIELNWALHDASLGEHEMNIIANQTAITELQTQTGGIEAALDGIIEIQNSLIGGDGV